jgi:hypothetical protein
MKNLLSENMMRFGTKNLTEAAKKELVLKSIMETIDQHGLRKAVRRALSEQQPDTGAKDPAWIAAASKMYASRAGFEGTYKPGSKFVQQNTYAAGGQNQGAIVILPKGTQWSVSPSGQFLIATAKKVNSLTEFGYIGKYGDAGQMRAGLEDGMYLAKLAADPTKVTNVPVAFYQGVLFYAGDTNGEGLAVQWPNGQLAKTLDAMRA